MIMNKLILTCCSVLLMGTLSLTVNAKETNYPLTVQHKYGISVVPNKPKRIVTLDWAGADNVLALGYQPLTSRYWFGDYKDGIWPWARTLLTSAPEVINGEINYEQIAATNPDVIMAVRSGISRQDYQQLSKIAPVIATPVGEGDYTMPWDKRARLLAQVLDENTQAQRLITTIEAQMSAVKKAHPDWAGKTFAMATYWNGSVGVYSGDDMTVNFISKMGLTLSPDVADLTRKGEFYMTLSEEELGVIDADVLFWYVTGDNKKQIESLALRPYMRAFKEGREIMLSPDSLVNGALSYSSLLSLPIAINQIVPLIEQAIDGDVNTVVPLAK
ncbi:iron complex transport system substrate-binding protein [Marinomonas alcarazii]|uniref:Iron complex transport system substrate-binding protein n=2 Tax=Marinomonas alcarazii TaxID=491949 RepID=A0A318V909_9GAMM|nr:iron complex transport system substrate-binding protein [Marinomonas alcarazii]